MATTHEQLCRILISVAYSLQYSLKDQIKPKHLAEHVFIFIYFYFIMLQSILHTRFTSSNHYIYFWFLQNFFFICCSAKLAPMCGLWKTLDYSHYYIHLALDLVNKKGITVRTVLMFTSEANAIMDRHTGNVISKELLWWFFTLKVLNLF